MEISDSETEESPEKSSDLDRVPIDMKSLCNDEIINEFLKLLEERNNNYEDALKLTCFTSFFFSAFNARGLSGVTRIVKYKDIFKKDLLVFPLHTLREENKGHWSVLVAQPKLNLIRSYDSLGQVYPNELRKVLCYLELLSEKEKISFNRSKWTLKGNPRLLPKQQNSVDCGFYVCFYVDILSKGINPYMVNIPTSENLRKAVSDALHKKDTNNLDQFLWPALQFKMR